MQTSHLSRVRTLYKTILKLHRGLPQELKLLGDNYVKDEFRRHKTCNADETNVFMNEWTNYALSLVDQLGLRGPSTGKSLGIRLSHCDLEKMTDDQIQQLYDLMLAATGEVSDETAKPP